MKNGDTGGPGLPIRVTGMPWFRREDFPRIKSLMEDGQRLHRTWEEWHAAAQKGEQSLQAQGHVVHRAVLLPDEFVAWCAARGIGLNAKSRMHFAALTAHEAHKNTH